MGIDHGNGHVKARSGFKKINLPSVYALPYEEREGYATSSSDNAIHTFEIEGAGTFLWGKNLAADTDKVLASIGNQYNKNEFRTLTTFAIGLLLPQNRMVNFDDITVVTGYPSIEKGTAQENALIAAFMGEHRMKVDGQAKTANVANVYALPQPLGTIMSLYLNDDGYVERPEYETSYCGIIDIGSGTTDLDGVNRLKRQQDDYTTIRKGMFHVYEDIAQDVSRRDDAKITPTAQMIEQQILAGNKEYVHSDRKTVPMEDIVEKHIGQFVTLVMNRIEQKWSKEKIDGFDRLILTGGGAANKYVERAFRAWQDDLIIVPNSQEANATGFYRYGKFKTQAGE